MRYTTNSNTYYININHAQKTDHVDHPQHMTTKERRHFSRAFMRFTTVNICNKNLQPIASATAFVGPGDRFCRRKGLSIALSRALRATNFTREERKEIYDQVFNKNNVWNKKIVRNQIIKLINSDTKLTKMFAQRLNMTTEQLQSFLKVK